MKVYVLNALRNTDEYAEENIGIFSSREKAEEIMNGEAKECFPDCEFFISEWEIDDFPWEILYKGIKFRYNESKRGNEK